MLSRRQLRLLLKEFCHSLPGRPLSQGKGQTAKGRNHWLLCPLPYGPCLSPLVFAPPLNQCCLVADGSCNTVQPRSGFQAAVGVSMKPLEASSREPGTPFTPHSHPKVMQLPFLPFWPVAFCPMPLFCLSCLSTKHVTCWSATHQLTC